jgi:hypothetical protein
MKWDDNGGQIRYECPNCRKAMVDTDALKAEWNAHGKYIVRNPAAKTHRSFTWPQWISGRWEPLVQEWLAAQLAKRSGLILPLKSFIQKRGGYFWKLDEDVAVAENEITLIEYEIDKEWPDEAHRFMSIDCQANLLLFYVVIRAWAKSGESRRLFRGRCESFEGLREIQKQFKVPSKFVGIDCGYEPSKIFRQCCRYVEANGRGWCAFRESDRVSFTHTFKDRTEQRIYSECDFGDPLLGLRNEDSRKWLEGVSPPAAKLYQAGTLKAPIYTLSRPSLSDILAVLRDGKGAPFTAPTADQRDAEEKIYRQHMAGEIKKPKRDKRGFIKELWVKIGPQHYWSCEKINLGQACLAGDVNPFPITVAE